MKPADAALLVRSWFDQYRRGVEMALARYGVSTAADRADLRQEVFIIAFLVLVRGDEIANPRAWLSECARKKASNHHRRESHRPRHAGGEVISTMASPAQLTEDREALCLALECLDKTSQDIVLAVRADGSSWPDVAAEHGISVARARYLYDVAVIQMDVALKRDDSMNGKHRAVAFPLFLVQVFDAIRAEVDSTSPELDCRVREGLDRFMESAGARAPDPGLKRVSFARPSPMRTPSTKPPATIVPVLGVIGGGAAIGVVAVYLLHGAPLDKPSPESSHARSTPARASIDSVEREDDAEVGARAVPAIGTRVVIGDLVAREIQDAGGDSAAEPLKGGLAPGSLRLIDCARGAFQAGNAQEALVLLAQHARRFHGKPDESARRRLLLLVCAAPAASAAAECAGAVPRRAPE